MKSTLWLALCIVFVAGCSKPEPVVQNSTTTNSTSETDTSKAAEPAKPADQPKVSDAATTPPKTGDAAAPTKPDAKAEPATKPAGTSSPAKPAALAKGEYAFKVHPKVGQTIHYAMVISVPSMPAGGIKFSLMVKVKDVSGGKTTTETSIENMSSGQPVPADAKAKLKALKVTQEMDETGKILSTKNSAGTPGTSSSAVGITFPDHPLKVGDTWQSRLEMGNQSQDVTYKLVGVTGSGSQQIAKIEITDLKIPNSTVAETPILKVNLGDGLLQSVTMKIVSGGPQGKPMLTVMTMKRV